MTMSTAPAPRHRLSVVVLHEGRILAIDTANPTGGPNYTFLPGGHLKANESIEDTARREVFEKTGYHVLADFNKKQFVRYEFTWTNQPVDCHSWIVLATLSPSDQSTEGQKSTNDGRQILWIPAEEIHSSLKVHPAILGAVEKLVGRTVAVENSITYDVNRPVKIHDISRLYELSGIQRPFEDIERMERMYENSNLVVSAWKGSELVGISRALTDYSYCCYLSDLAVHKDHQKQGIGRTLLRLTKEAAGPGSMLLLLAARDAMDYYPRVGFAEVKNGFLIRRDS